MFLQKRFWKRWVAADELEQLRMIEKLPVCQLDIRPELGLGTVLNSYLRDLADYLRHRDKMADALFDATKAVFVDAEDRGETCGDDGKEFKDWERLRKALKEYESKRR